MNQIGGGVIEKMVNAMFLVQVIKIMWLNFWGHLIGLHSVIINDKMGSIKSEGLLSGLLYSLGLLANLGQILNTVLIFANF